MKQIRQVALSRFGIPVKYLVRDGITIYENSLAMVRKTTAQADDEHGVPTEIFLDASHRKAHFNDRDSIDLEKSLRAVTEVFDEIPKTDGASTNQLIKCLRRAVNEFVSHAIGQQEFEEKDVIAMIAGKWLLCYHLQLFTKGDEPSLFRDLYRVSLAGLCPIAWRGKWPQGFCVAYAPAEHSWIRQGLPPTWRPASGAIERSKSKPRHSKPLVLPVPVEEPAGSGADWEALAAHRDPTAAIAAWWAPWAETPACRKALKAVAARVQRIEATSSALRLHVLRRFDEEPGIVLAARPYTGALKPMPRSAARLIRRHNGIAVIRLVGGREHDRDVLCPGYAKGVFPIEFAAWWTPNARNPDEPFIKPPLVPCTDGQDIWAYHPLRLRSPGELELRRIDHEDGHLCAALPYGAGGVVLRLLADLLVPERSGRRADFGLRLDRDEEERTTR